MAHLNKLNFKETLSKYLFRIKRKFSLNRVFQKNKSAVDQKKENLSIRESVYKTFASKATDFKFNVMSEHRVFKTDNAQYIGQHILSYESDILHALQRWKKDSIVNYNEETEKLIQQTIAELDSDCYDSSNGREAYDVVALKGYFERVEKFVNENSKLVSNKYFNELFEDLNALLSRGANEIKNLDKLEMGYGDQKEPVYVVDESLEIGTIVDQIKKKINDVRDLYITKQRLEKLGKNGEERLRGLNEYGIKIENRRDVYDLSKERGISLAEAQEILYPENALFKKMYDFSNDKTPIPTITMMKQYGKDSNLFENIRKISESIEILDYKEKPLQDFSLEEMVEKLSQDSLFQEKFLSKEPLSDQEIEYFFNLFSGSIKEAIDNSSYACGLMPTFHLKDTNKSGLHGLNVSSRTGRNKIFVYKNQIDKNQPASMQLTQMMITLLHEVGHGFDGYFQMVNNDVVKEKFFLQDEYTAMPENEVLELFRPAGSVEGLTDEHLFVLSFYSPTLVDFIKQVGSDKMDKLAQTINFSYYYTHREEQFARQFSEEGFKFVADKLANHFESSKHRNPELVAKLQDLSGRAEELSNSCTAYKALEGESDFSKIIADILNDFKQIHDIDQIDLVCQDFGFSDLKNQNADSLNNLADNLFKSYYEGLSEEQKLEFIKKSVSGCCHNILKKVTKESGSEWNNERFPFVDKLSEDDLYNFYINAVDKKSLSTFDYKLKLLFKDKKELDEMAGEPRFKNVLERLIKESRVDSLNVFLSSGNENDYEMLINAVDGDLISYMQNLPKEVKYSRDYKEMLFSMSVNLKFNDLNIDDEKKDEVLKYIDKELKSIDEYSEEIKNRTEDKKTPNGVISALPQIKGVPSVLDSGEEEPNQ